MSYAQDNGYIPSSFTELMDFVRQGINQQFGTAWTPENFVGTGWYKFYYQLVQKTLENETRTAEIFLKLQEYIRITNQKIQRPSVSFPGLLDSFESKGYRVSVKPPVLADAGKISIAVDVDPLAPDYTAKKAEIAGLIKDFVAAGIVSQGDQVTSVTLSNGQSFDFKFFLPTYIPVLLRLTAEVSENNLLAIPSDEEIRQKIFDTIPQRYRLGWNFEPQRYYTLSDALWAGEVKLEWSTDNGTTWNDDIYDADFDEVFTFDLEDIQVVIT